LVHSGTDFTIEFYAYRDALPHDCISNVFSNALSKALANPYEQRISPERIEFWDRPAQLILFPGESMTWIMWVKALWLMREFVQEKAMSFEWQFIVLAPGLADVGRGALLNGLVKEKGDMYKPS